MMMQKNRIEINNQEFGLPEVEVNKSPTENKTKKSKYQKYGKKEEDNQNLQKHQIEVMVLSKFDPVDSAFPGGIPQSSNLMNSNSEVKTGALG